MQVLEQCTFFCLKQVLFTISIATYIQFLVFEGIARPDNSLFLNDYLLSFVVDSLGRNSDNYCLEKLKNVKNINKTILF
jgi:hypothetical protein